MIASKLLASSALALAFWSTAAAADETAKPPVRGNVVTVATVKINARPQTPHVAIDVARLVPRAPLPEMRQLFVDRIGQAVEGAPF